MSFRKEGRAVARPVFGTDSATPSADPRAVPEVAAYAATLKQQLAQGGAQEHAYRPALMKLLEALGSDIVAMNDPESDHGKRPDVVLKRKKVAVGYGEAKDLGMSLEKTEASAQFQGYLGKFDKIFLTDYLEFRFYKAQACYATVRIGTYDKGAITLHPKAFAALAAEIQDFIEASGTTITNPKELARLMAIKARLLRERVVAACEEDEKAGNTKTELMEWRSAFSQILLPNLPSAEFADLFAQTVTYGLFSARFNDDTPETFTRSEANELIPKTNPFLRKFFNSIAGPDLDPRVVRQVDELAELFARTDVYDILDAFAGDTKKDPILYFYEEFLLAYDPALKKKRGVFYTPEAVVSYIVRSADILLREKFGLTDGLADRSMVENGKGRMHTVQILDPAVGTGTFLSAVVSLIAERFEGQEGVWSTYVDEHLLPRIHGFEILMAPYAICHLKLTLLLQKRGYIATGTRLGVYLTNSLEPELPEAQSLFAKWLSEEANAASHIKKEVPVMLVLGNPPYNAKSKNKGKHILSLIAAYKEGLDETSYNSLSDDYVKFIRFAEELVERTGRGIVAMITNNSFLDGITHRRMREHLRETFDEIYVLDLHGNAKRKETAPDGSKDDNVFNIQQGVSIILFVKTSTSKALARVKHAEMHGKREQKYMRLSAEDVAATKWTQLSAALPNHFFVPRDAALDDDYGRGLSLSELFRIYGSGVKFRKDNLLVRKHFTPESAITMVHDVQDLSDAELKKKYGFEETEDWKLEDKRSLFSGSSDGNIRPVSYRPFDTRYTYYPVEKINEIIVRGDSRVKLMKHMFTGENVSLLICRFISSSSYQHAFVADNISECSVVSGQTREMNYVAPLYLYDFDQEGNPTTRLPNFDAKVFAEITQRLGFEPTPEDLFDYIYAVLHSPTYRSRYGEQLKIDFPRVPFTSNKALFTSLSKLGSELRALHLLKSPLLSKPPVKFPAGGDCVVEKVRYDAESEHVWINKTQYFSGVSSIAWEHWIGGYQPAQKWLKDRKGRALSTDDVLHYEKVIVAVSETARLMKEVDAVIEKGGGWPMK